MQKTTLFEPTIESLKGYQCPQWFRDAKFGIYLHWGVYSVVERGEWYPRRMYIEGSPEYEHHVETYGHPSQFGYKDFVPMWTAERFDPVRLVSLFKRAGARYFCPCAVHHDNFDLWNSRHHRWNSVEMGPKQDITGLWREAALEHGLRFGVTTHLARSYSWFNVNKGADSAGPLAGVPYDGNDPHYRDLYHEPHPDTDLRHPLNPPEHWRRAWATRIRDLIDHYRPDHLYFDGALPFQGDDGYRTGMEVLAHYYNQSAAWHGEQQCVMCLKNIPDHGLYVEGIATLDLERRRAEALLAEPWQTDTSIGPWGYDVRRPYRPVGEIVRELVDIVSKNGNMLLNVPPKADGTLDEATERILEDIGRWMDVTGEAIYGTRPWHVYGEGDVRFTHKGNVLYAVALEWPERELRITSLGERGVRAVSLLGSAEPLSWVLDERGLIVQVPLQKPCEHAYAFRIVLTGAK
jgi:alpha-L-fucosidase